MYENPLFTPFIVLLAAVLSVGLFRALQLSPVLGYLAAGLAIGPYGLKLVDTTASKSMIAEFGVVFLLFMIGLELSFNRLKAMRRHVFGLGTAQVLLTSAAFGLVAYYHGQPLYAAILIGGGLAMSSTAIVLQVAGESGQRHTQTGRLALAMLILQDLAIIPLLVLVQVFAEGEELGRAMLVATTKAVAAAVIIVIIGRRIIRPLFRMVTHLRDQELITATTLLMVIATSYVSYVAGLSPAMGAFMAGLLIAETEYKLQVEADIMPYKGLFLGLFFMTVGMSLDWRFVFENWLMITAIVIGVLVIKGMIIYTLARIFSMPIGTSVNAGLIMSQAGEFAFVVFGLAASSNLLAREVAEMLLVVTTATMAITPMLAEFGHRLELQFGEKDRHSLRHSLEESTDLSDHVIISGFGRVGHTVARLLEAEGVPYIALDVNPLLVRAERAKGMPIHFGDASRKLVLKAVGMERARAMVITHADASISSRTIMAARGIKTEIPIIVRARNIEQVQQLERLGANLAIAEMFETSLQLGGALLREIGIEPHEVASVLDAFRASDYALTRVAEGEEEVAAV